jgi:hypothetical protein
LISVLDGCSFLFQGFWGLPLCILNLIKRRFPLLVYDRTDDWRQVTDDPDAWTIFDPASWMLDLKNFGLEGRTGVESVGEFLGLNLGVKKKGWVCKESGRTTIRWKHWNKDP